MKILRITVLASIFFFCITFTSIILKKSYNQSLSNDWQQNVQSQVHVLKSAFLNEEFVLKKNLLESYSNNSSFTQSQGPFLMAFAQYQDNAIPFWQKNTQSENFSQEELAKIYNFTFSNKSDDPGVQYLFYEEDNNTRLLLFVAAIQAGMKPAQIVGILPAHHFVKLLGVVSLASQNYIFNQSGEALFHNKEEYIGLKLKENSLVQTILQGSTIKGTIKGGYVQEPFQAAYENIKKEGLWVLVKKTYGPLTMARVTWLLIPLFVVFVMGMIYLYYLFEPKLLNEKEKNQDEEIQGPDNNDIYPLKEDKVSPHLANSLGSKDVNEDISVYEIDEDHELIEDLVNETFVASHGLKQTIDMPVEVVSLDELPIYNEDELEGFLKGLKIDLKTSQIKTKIRKPKLNLDSPLEKDE